jgi:hypothetical protein
MDIRGGHRNLAEQIAKVLEALSGLNINNNIINNMEGELILSHVARYRLKRITSF